MRHLLLLLLASGVLAACDGFGPSDAIKDLADPRTDPALLLDGPWVAVSAVSDGDAFEFTASDFTAGFSDDGYVGGRTSANSYGGDYEAGADGSFAAGDIVTTLVGESARAERLSGVLLREISEATTFEVDGPVLQLRAPNGDGLRFIRAAEE
ncbi:META domain-containing protein [Rubricoccus marinus]|uniref:DUF306 domain-containing protein n=1 Tax=Rubricoccus marinus TaxID=716817 RepID=A0A259U3H5_9BACT|nr:META domain-containing protein [Rubricoccus marinus]OZC04502.1 hypothetical protein BSZ36_16885 [Rubricoccus marinus]